MAESDVITDVIIPPPPAGFKPPQTLISFRAHERLRARRRAARRSGQAEIHRVHDDHPQDRERTGVTYGAAADRNGYWATMIHPVPQQVFAPAVIL